jgi:hypothetical protein
MSCMSWRAAPFVLAAALAGAGVLRAEEPPVPPPGAAEPVAPEAPVAPEEGKPFDLLVYLGHVRTLVSENVVPPRRTANDHGLYDTWGAILRPRAARILGRVKRLMEPGFWEFDPVDARAVHLKSTAWNTAIGELGSLYTELGGALEQYAQAKVTITQVRPDESRPPPIGPVSGELALAALETDLLRRARLGGVVWADEVYWYRHLLGRVQAALELRAEQIRRYEERQAEIEDEFTSLVTSIENGLAEKQQSLALQMLTVRSLAAAIQAREEERLNALVGKIPAGDVRAASEKVLLGLRTSRLAAESHVEPPVSEYGAILRRWLKGQQDLLAALRKAGVDASSAVPLAPVAKPN